MTHNLNRLILFWNVLVVLTAIYVALVIPFGVAFDTIVGSSSLLQWLVSIVFAVDFVLHARSFKQLDKDRMYIGKPWHRRMLLFTDLMAAVPYGIIFNYLPLKIFRLFKLFRVFYFIRGIAETKVKTGSMFTFFSFVFWFFLIVHWLACGWILLANGEHPGTIGDRYTDALYWTVTTLTTVGYGDIVPQTNPQKIFAIVVQILGFGVFGFLIGTVASQLMRKDPARSRYQKNIEGLASLMHYRTLPNDLKNRILDFYRFMWRQRVGYDETAFLNSLPENLRTLAALHLKKEVIEKVSLFHKTSAEFRKEIALLLKPIFLTPGDYIFRAGDLGENMYFVVSGDLQTLTQKEDRVLTLLKSGDYFGEIALFKNKNRSATVRALSYCDLYSLHKTAFDQVVSKYPYFEQKIHDMVESRERKYSVG